MGFWENRRRHSDGSPEVIGRCMDVGTLLRGNRYRTLRDRMIYFGGKIDLLGESFSWICNNLGYECSVEEHKLYRNQYIYSKITIFIYV